MDIAFTTPRIEDAEKIAPFYWMRPNKTCDSGVLDTFLWADYYQLKYAIVDDAAILTLMKDGDEYFSSMPYCAEDTLQKYFLLCQQYFNEVLHKPLKIYLADEEAVITLGLKEDGRYLVKEEEDLKDYLYTGDDLRNLPGKKFHKKKNLVNKFFREYEGRWEYRALDCKDKTLIWDFLDRWYEKRSQEEAESEGTTLEYEVRGIHTVLKDGCSSPVIRIGGIFIDGKLEAFSIGGMNPKENMACIAIEKGNPEISGIYQVINQQFLIHAFPEATLVNREDDVGIPGLRQAKESYNPCGYARKYMVLQKNFTGWKEEAADHYEDNITQNQSGQQA